MRKLLKALGILLLAAVCVACFGAAEAKADETDGVNIVYANVPEDWQNPCVWAWGDDGANAFEAWPGGEMTADEGNPGWYYIYVPDFVTSVIVNANEGSVQTSDIANGAADCWITVKSAEEAEITAEKQTEGELPEYVAEFRVNAYVPDDWAMPCLWAWSAPDGTNVFANWPGGEMAQSPDGWYSYSVPDWVNSVIVNANAGAVKTSDISVEPKELWIVISDAENYELYYEKPELEEETITVRAKAPEDWLMPCLWAWSAPDGTNVFANWPGEEMAPEGEWYTYSIPAWVNSIIVNGNLGGVQTTDISIEPKDVWIIIGGADDNYSVFYEEPTAEQIAEASGMGGGTLPEPTSEPEADASGAQEPEEGAQALAAADTEETKSNTVLYVVLAVAVIAVIAAVFVVIKRKKK